jgi:hypothetical protein
MPVHVSHPDGEAKCWLSPDVVRAEVHASGSSFRPMTIVTSLNRRLSSCPQAVPPEAHESLGSRKTVAEVPLAGLFFRG